MTVESFSANDLFDWLVNKEDFLLLDVRNDVEFARFKVEGPYPFAMVNVPYMEFIEMEEESVAKVPPGKRVRVVCAKEGSSKFVAEILANHGFTDVAHLKVGIKAWGNLLAPVLVAKGNDYSLYQFRRPGKASLSYGLISGKEMVVFDPAKDANFYTAFAESKGCTITKTFETHRQADYISGSDQLRRSADVEIVAPDDDFKVAKFPYTPARDGETHHINGGHHIAVIHTPGHTPGSTCYSIDGKYLVTGDTVFIQSIGRPDLGGMAEEWSYTLFKTMTETLIPLHDDTVILPGHYMEWDEANANLIFAATMGEIKKRNADIYRIDNEKAFYDFIKANMRQQPEEYAKIRDINAGLLDVDEEEQEIMDIGKNECAASMNQA